MTDELPEGETVELEDDVSDVEDTEDGGALVRLEDDGPKKGDSEFYANLAEEMDETALNGIATSFLDLIARDKEARKKRDEQYEEGIRRTGLGDDAPGGASFQGASRVVHPMLTEVCVDFSSRAIKELFPADGPVKDKIVGKLTKGRVEKARRKTDFMNWQLTVQSQNFRSELEQLLTQVPLGGAQYMKLGWDEARNRPTFLFVAIDDMLLPYAASSFYSAQRKTHVQYLTSVDFADRVKSGMYRDIDLMPPGNEPEGSKSEQANNKVEGREDTSYNEDGLRTVYEIYAITDLDNDDGLAPYIITVDKTSTQVLSIYRNWDEDDESLEEQQWIVEFPFVPWRGAYPIGITHMIGGLSAAATGALRALMDSAHISNSQTMLKLKGGSRGGQSLNIQPTQVEEIEGGLNVDDIRKVAMPLPFNPPSSVLFQLLGFLVDAGKGVVRTTMDDVSDSNQNVPVGTTLAKIEQGMVVFSAIHGRLHDAMGRMLRIQHRLNAMYLDDGEQREEIGTEIAKRSDFDGPMDVVPVSDPNIFSEAQRFAQVQAVAQRSQMFPQLYDLRKVEERILDTLKISDAAALLAPKLTPTEENAVSENVKATLGRPVVAFPEQDHIAHLKTHLAYMMSPALGMSRLIAPAYLPIMLNHIKEHIAFWYADEVFKVADEDADLDVEKAMHEMEDVETKQAFDRMLAEASLNVALKASEAFAPLPDVIEKAIAAIQSIQPPVPPDPATQAAMADIQMRAEVEKSKVALEEMKLKLSEQQEQNRVALEQAKLAGAAEERAAREVLEARKLAGEMEIERMREENADTAAAAEIQAKIAMNDADNRTAIELAEIEVANQINVPSALNHDPGP